MRHTFKAQLCFLVVVVVVVAFGYPIVPELFVQNNNNNNNNIRKLSLSTLNCHYIFVKNLLTMYVGSGVLIPPADLCSFFCQCHTILTVVS